jgi:hypothetical protein
MVAVAVLAAVVWVVERRERFRRIALGHRLEKSEVFRNDLEIYLIAIVEPGESDTQQAERERVSRPFIQFSRYHDQMIEKYERAANRPWLPVASDPPPPTRLSRDDFKAVYVRLEGEPFDLDQPQPK